MTEQSPGMQGEFRLLHKIGEGGMADVFLAERLGDDGFKTRVALKRLHRGLAMDSYFIRQLVREARLLGQLEHANIVRVFDLRRIGDEYYVVMEYVDGIDLAAVMKVHRKRNTRIPRPFFFHVALSLSEALSYAHNAVDEDGNTTPLIHRDIKPSNVMLSRRGVVKLTDFGIAHVGDGSVTDGMVQGTANYMSPEQAYGDERLTAASDIYSLGSVYFEMLTGRCLIDGENYLKAIHQVRQRNVDVDELAELGVEPGLRMVIARMLARDLKDRYTEVESVRNDLQFVADRLKVDLSWHRIRSYVGRLMSILGRAEVRATLSNLEVPAELDRFSNTNSAPGVPSDESLLPEKSSPEPMSSGPKTPTTPPPLAAHKLNIEVTSAVQKDFLEAQLETLEGEGDEQEGAEALPQEEPADWAEGDETLALDRLESPPPEIKDLEVASRTPTPAPLPGEDEVKSEQSAPLPEEPAGPGEWDDNEATSVYTGKSPAEMGVVGAGKLAELPSQIEDKTVPYVPGTLSQSLEPLPATPSVLGTPEQEAPTPSPGPLPRESGTSAAANQDTDSETWLFSDSSSDQKAPTQEPLAATTALPAVPKQQVEAPPRPKRRRKKKRRKKKRVSKALVASLVLAIVAVVVVLLILLASRLRSMSSMDLEPPDPVQAVQASPMEGINGEAHGILRRQQANRSHPEPPTAATAGPLRSSAVGNVAS